MAASLAARSSSTRQACPLHVGLPSDRCRLVATKTEVKGQLRNHAPFWPPETGVTFVFRAGTGTPRNPVNLAAARWVSAPVLIIEKEAEDEISNTRDCIRARRHGDAAAVGASTAGERHRCLLRE
jgi:hypothetical protein